ncbi:5041_t:CDS:2, partial [Dentiscutata erythropus]
IDSSDSTLDNDYICKNESETSNKEGQNEDRTRLNVNTDRIMAFSGHHSLGGVASYQTFTKKIMNTTVAIIILDNQIAYRIRPRITKPRPFKLFDASKPFVSPLKRSLAKIIEKNTQEILLEKIIEEDTQKILPAITSNTA